jgi:hypothetical protein
MEDINKSAGPNRLSVHKLILGIVLMTFGVLAFVDTNDLWNPRELWRLWPVAVILIGLASEVDALIARRGSGGSFLIAFGVWMLVARHGIFDLTHRTAFPLAIAVVGLFMTLHALIDKAAPQPQKKETNHEPC